MQEANHRAAGYNVNRLFIASCMSLATGAMVFIVRASVQDDLRAKFETTQEQIGAVMGLWALGIAATIFVSSWLCDLVGIGNLLRAACILHLVSIPLTIVAPDLNFLRIAVVLTGLAHGFIEGSINPLIATIYPDQKVHKLNVLHAWWPGGLVIGGLMAEGLGKLGVSWQLKLGVIMIPAACYGLLIIGQRFPRTERVTSGVSYGTMILQVFQPLFLLMAICMLFTAATELGPDQWMPSVLKATANIPGTLIFVWGSGLMFVMRFFAGALAHKINPVGILLFSSVLSCVGLFALSFASSWPLAFATGTIFYVGICYYWPTMLGVVSEQFPKGGAFTLSLMGTMGMLSIWTTLPLMGKIRDEHTVKAIQEISPNVAAVVVKDGKVVPNAEKLLADPADKDALKSADARGAAMTFRVWSATPLFLIVVFGLMLGWFQLRGGYKPVQIGVTVKEGKAVAVS